MTTNVYTALQLQARDAVALAIATANRVNARVNLTLAGGSEDNPGRVSVQLEQVGLDHGTYSTVPRPDYAHYAGNLRDAAEQLEYGAYRAVLSFSITGTINGKAVGEGYPLTIYVNVDKRTGTIYSGPYRYDELTESGRKVIRVIGDNIAHQIDLAHERTKAILWEQHTLDLIDKLDEATRALAEMTVTAFKIHEQAVARVDSFFSTKQ